MRLTYSSQDKVAYLYLTEVAEGEIAETANIEHPKIKGRMVFDLDRHGASSALSSFHRRASRSLP